MSETRKRIEEIDEQIDALRKERSKLNYELDSEQFSKELVNMLTHVEMKVLYDNVLVLNCFDADHLYYDEIKPFMNKLIKRIVEELGNPPYVDLQDARVDNHYYFNPYYRVLMFNVDYSNLDTLSSVIEKLKR